MTALYNHRETRVTAYFKHSNEDGMVFIENGHEITIAPENVEQIVNFGNPNLPPFFYREKKVFSKTEN